MIMKVYGIDISDDRGLTNIALYRYARELKIVNFRGVFMRNTLPRIPHQTECGIVNFNSLNMQVLTAYVISKME